MAAAIKATTKAQKQMWRFDKKGCVNSDLTEYKNRIERDVQANRAEMKENTLVIKPIKMAKRSAPRESSRFSSSGYF
ncbi:hypothetical protein O9993_22505 [Vibrio lentus]|nr:hypothetical protein [Vibrio lentus]